MIAQKGKNVQNAALEQSFRQVEAEVSNAHFATRLRCKTIFAVDVAVR